MDRHPLDVPRETWAAFCRRWGVAELALFGSALRDDFGPESDVDLLVSFEPAAHPGLFDVAAMELELERELGRPVELMTKRAVEESHNRIRRDAILSTARLLFARAGSEEVL